MEVDIEEDCLKILALHQPVARDLRFLIAVIKINNELERIGDIAVNIAMRVDNISKFKHAKAISYDFSKMSEKAILMLTQLSEKDIVAAEALVKIKEKCAKPHDLVPYDLRTFNILIYEFILSLEN